MMCVAPIDPPSPSSPHASPPSSDTRPAPLPTPTPISEPFWDGLRRGEIRIQVCRACDARVFYPRAHCPRCFGRVLDWRIASRAARLVTWTITHRPTSPAFAEHVPQCIAVVELNEGIRLTTTIVEAERAELRRGIALEPVFDEVAPEVVVLRFRPRRPQATRPDEGDRR